MKKKISRVEKERRVVELMVRLWCRRKEGNAGLCPECETLIAYASARLERCPHGERKPTCRKCPIHCYAPLQRERIRAVMRWAGPRMLLYHPLEALRHAVREL